MSYDRIAIVVGTARERDHLQRDLDPKRERFLVISSEQVVAGYRFNSVLVTDSFHVRAYNSGWTQKHRMMRWLEEDVWMRRMKDAPMVRL